MVEGKSKTVDDSLEEFEGKSWFIATLVMVLVSSTTFIFQRFVVRLFSYAFEVCVFYVPTLVLLIVYLKKKS